MQTAPANFKKTLSGSGEGKVEVLNLKAKPEVVDKLISNHFIYPILFILQLQK